MCCWIQLRCVEGYTRYRFAHANEICNKIQRKLSSRLLHESCPILGCRTHLAVCFLNFFFTQFASTLVISFVFRLCRSISFEMIVKTLFSTHFTCTNRVGINVVLTSSNWLCIYETNDYWQFIETCMCCVRSMKFFLNFTNPIYFMSKFTLHWFELFWLWIILWLQFRIGDNKH